MTEAHSAAGKRKRGGTGNFFIVDQRLWKAVCDAGDINAAAAWLVLLRGTGFDQRTTAWSVDSLMRYLHVGYVYGKAAIDKLIARNFIRYGEKHTQRKPRYEFLTFPEWDALKRNQPKRQSATEEEDADYNLIWVPNQIIDGAAGEKPPIYKLRASGDLWALRLFIDLYHEHNLRDEGGISRTLIWEEYKTVAKAQRYAQEMLTHSADEWRFGLTSTFVLEYVARAALANVSPTLLADQKDWNNIYFALGHTPTASKFVPRSLDVSAVFKYLRDILPSFTIDQEGFAAQHLNRRNEELHTGGTPFDGVKPEWLAPFYLSCKILLESMGKKLPFLFGKEQADSAEKLIAASLDLSAKAVMKSIAAHRTVWESKGVAEKEKAKSQASSWAIRQSGHRVNCPACANEALVTGTAVSGPIRALKGNLIVNKQQYLPSKFECVACQLKIAGLAGLAAAGLGAQYTQTTTYDAASYFAPDDEHAGFDDDNNEY